MGGPSPFLSPLNGVLLSGLFGAQVTLAMRKQHCSHTGLLVEWHSCHITPAEPAPRGWRTTHARRDSRPAPVQGLRAQGEDGMDVTRGRRCIHTAC